MKFLPEKLISILEKAPVLYGLLCVLLPISPANMANTTRDSGVFLYIGWRILNGELPYQDIWDHKPPVVFYLNALGLTISSNSRWGVWLIETAFLATAAFIGFYLLKKALGTIPAMLSSLAWLLTLTFVIEGGNFTEEYVLPLQFAALWLAADLDKPGRSWWRVFLIGVLGGLAFCTKQTSVGIWVAISMYLTFQRLTSRQTRRWLSEMSYLTLGGGMILGVTALFFGVQGAFDQFWSAAFSFNFVYSSGVVNFLTRIAPILYAISPLASTGLFQFSMMGAVFSIIAIGFKRSTVTHLLPLLLIGLVDLALEMVLLCVSGRSYDHYYISILPILALFAGVFFWVLGSQLVSWSVPLLAKTLFLVGLSGIFLWSSYGIYLDQVRLFHNFGDVTVARFVAETTEPDEMVLFWGAETTSNFVAQRRSPTRFVYQNPLYIQGYTNEKLIEEFLQDILRNQPRYIIDTKNPYTPIFDFPIHSLAIDRVIAEIQSYYPTTLDMGMWTIYEYSNVSP